VDLFNPPPKYNMSKKIELGVLDNPYVQVVWEDTPDNFTQERIKSVKQYFQKKYSTTNVNVVTKLKGVEDEVMQTVDVSLNIMDKNYQAELIKSYLKSKGLEEYTEKVMDIDRLVESKIAAEQEDVSAFKKWYIKRIEFSNFLSYGTNQVLDFTKCDGITAVESDPPNFGGKTVLTVDLLMFLFFNTTTKTSKAEEVFNRFSDENTVSVRGEVTIDGEDYILVRKLERKKAKSGDWNVKTELDFFKKLADGQLQNFTGEQRRETEKFIKNSIGTQEDFLMTILTTASNLEELLEAKPTARGQVLSRFLGLEFLKIKETVGKELASDFTKTMMSNIYSTEQLNQDNEEHGGKIAEFSERNKSIDTEIKDVKERIQKGIDYRDSLVSQKHTDIDQEIAILNVGVLETEITDLMNQKETQENNIKSIKIVEPKEFYHEDKHDEIKSKLNDKNIAKSHITIQIEGIDKLSASVAGGIKCEHCGIELINAELTKARIAEKDELLSKKQQLEKEVEELDKQDKSYAQLKKDFDEYEKNKLIKEKYEAALESTVLKLDAKTSTKKKYFEQKSKIEENKKLDETILKAGQRLTELSGEESKLEREKGANLSQIENLQRQIQKNNDIILKIAQEFEREKIYKMFLDVFGKNGISKIIMKTMMPLINSELQRLLQDSAYFRLEIRISDKNEVEFVMIDNSTGVEKLMVSGSGYEKTIASLALRAVLSKICSLPKPNVIVFDEVFGKISNDNLEMVGEFFTKIKEYFEKIFVITHNPLVSNWSDNVVRIKKENNISKVSQ
jgi:DNA repair exonuclease SbcCD ATPase subunit